MSITNAFRIALRKASELVYDDSVTNLGLAPADQNVQKAIEAVAGVEGVPSGCILMWSGSVATIPGGWFLCDGSNGTPDLRNRFIVGAGSQYSVGDTGGAAEVILTTAEMPAHSHTGSTNSTGDHTHSVSNVLGFGTGSLNLEGGGSSLGGTTTTSSAGSHSHSLNINNTGGGEAHENRPPYYALCYIMKG